MNAPLKTVRIVDKGIGMVLELSVELYEFMLESEYIAVVERDGGRLVEITPAGYAYLQACRQRDQAAT